MFLGNRYLCTNIHSNQKELLDDIAKRLNIQTTDDWVKISITDFKRHGGGELIKVYGSILSCTSYTSILMLKGLQTVYHDQQVPFWNFKQKTDAWHDQANQKRFITHLASKVSRTLSLII